MNWVKMREARPTLTQAVRTIVVKRLVICASIALIVFAALCARVASAAEPDARGPDVTVVAGEKRTVYEYRQAGQLRMIKVVPKHGPSYYLVPRDETRGFGDLERADMLIARWTILEF
jgi:uncharacterized protein DUF2782